MIFREFRRVLSLLIVCSLYFFISFAYAQILGDSGAMVLSLFSIPPLEFILSTEGRVDGDMVIPKS